MGGGGAAWRGGSRRRAAATLEVLPVGRHRRSARRRGRRRLARNHVLFRARRRRRVHRGQLLLRSGGLGGGGLGALLLGLLRDGARTHGVRPQRQREDRRAVRFDCVTVVQRAPRADGVEVDGARLRPDDDEVAAGAVGEGADAGGERRERLQQPHAVNHVPAMPRPVRRPGEHGGIRALLGGRRGPPPDEERAEWPDGAGGVEGGGGEGARTRVRRSLAVRVRQRPCRQPGRRVRTRAGRGDRVGRPVDHVLGLVEIGVVGAAADEDALGGDLEEGRDRQRVLLRDRQALDQRLRRQQHLQQHLPIVDRVAAPARIGAQPVADRKGVKVTQHRLARRLSHELTHRHRRGRFLALLRQLLQIPLRARLAAVDQLEALHQVCHGSILMDLRHRGLDATVLCARELPKQRVGGLALLLTHPAVRLRRLRPSCGVVDRLLQDLG